MTSTELITYFLPTHWIGPLFNDDYSEFSDEEENEVRDFLNRAKGCPVSFDEDSRSFYPFNDAGTKACECYVYYFQIT